MPLIGGIKVITRGLGWQMDTGRERLGEYILARRQALDFSREQLAALAGLSVSRISQIERGRSSDKPPNRAEGWDNLERALGWMRGSCRMIFNGGEPVLQDPLNVGTFYSSEDGLSQAIVAGPMEGRQALAMELMRQAEELLKEARRLNSPPPPEIGS